MTRPAGETAATMGRSIASQARLARNRAMHGNAEQRSVAAGGMVVLSALLAVVTGALAVAAVHGNGGAAFGVIVLGVLFGMALLASIVLAVRPHSSPASTLLAEPAVDEESQQLGRALEHAADTLGLSGRGWAVGREAISRWIGADAEDIEAWTRGRSAIPPVQAERVRAFVEMATTLEDTIRGDRLPMILATRPVLMLGGRTYFQALNDGAPIEVVADSARLALGAEHVETEAGQAYVARRTKVLWEPGTTPPARRRKPAAKPASRAARVRT